MTATPGAAVTMYTTTWCGYCVRLKKLMQREGIEYAEVDIERDEEAADVVMAAIGGNRTVPTLVFPDGQSLFGPVVIDPPTGDAAVRLWRAVTAWLEFPHLYELQRPKAAADVHHIAQSLQPYLGARDWVSIDRGDVISFGAYDPKEQTT